MDLGGNGAAWGTREGQGGGGQAISKQLPRSKVKQEEGERKEGMREEKEKEKMRLIHME